MDWLSIGLIPIVHELGHYAAARLFGSRLRFTFEWGKFGVPRWTWRWPDVTKSQLRIICHAGFGLEFVLIPLMPWQYQVAAVLHYIAYPFYAGEVSDFEGIVKR